MKFKILILIIISIVLWQCNRDNSIINAKLAKVVDNSPKYLKIYIAPHDNEHPLVTDSIPKAALDSIILTEEYTKNIKEAKVIDFKNLHSNLSGNTINITVSGSVNGCENIVYVFEPINDSLYRFGSFKPGPSITISGTFTPDPGKEYPPMYALFLDTDTNNTGIITLHYSDEDTTISYDINAAKHTVLLDDANVYRFKLNHLPNVYDYLELYYINKKSNFQAGEQFLFLIPIETELYGYRLVYRLIKTNQNNLYGHSSYTISSWNGKISFPDEYSYAFRVKFPHKNN